MAGTHSESADFPSLIDDLTFLAELDKLEGEALAAPVTRPVYARRPAAPALIEPVIPCDVNRWHLHPPPGVDPEPAIRQRPSTLSAILAILIGLSAGGAGSAAVFYDRLTQIIALFAN
jgi:hypothetical protein